MYDEKQLRRKRLFFRLKLYFVCGGAGLLLLALLVLLRGPFFQIQEVEIRGLKSFRSEEFFVKLHDAAIGDFLTGLLGPKNYLVWLKKIQYNHPAILKMTLERDFWKRRLVFNVEEREPYGIWCFPAGAEREESCHWFDAAGVLFKKAPLTEGFEIYKVRDSDSNSDADPPAADVLKILTVLSERKIALKQINLDRKKQEASAVTQEGAKIIFSLRFDVTATLISALDTVVKKVGFKNMEYLDLTVENRIYYK